MQDIDKYINNELSNVPEIQQLLSENNNKAINYFDDSHLKYNGNAHTEILRNFLNIEDKNTLSNLEYFFYKNTRINEYYTTFPLSKLLNYKENNLYIILPDIVKQKYLNQIIEPLKQVFLRKDNNFNFICLNDTKSKMSLSTYIYNDDKGETMEVLLPNHSLKNSIYGLLKYSFLDESLFYNKSLLLYKYKTTLIKKEDINEVKAFFRSLSLKNYCFDLKLNSINNEESQNDIILNLYLNENTNQKIISFEDFRIDFMLEIFKYLYTLDSILDNLKKSNMKIIATCYNTHIDVFINNKYIKFEVDPNLFASFLRDISKTIKFSKFQEIKYFFSSIIYPEKIDASFYYQNKQELLYKFGAKLENVI